MRAPVVILAHNKVDLALHELRPDTVGAGTLLLLHGLGEETPAELPTELARWQGGVSGLDFTGHGVSSTPLGGGYTAEALAADADQALARLGPCTILGRGLGGYVGLLLAGARPEQVRGLIIADGPGIEGGPAQAESVAAVLVPPEAPGRVPPKAPGRVPPKAPGRAAPDPFALLELSRDVRTADYALAYAREAVRGSVVDPAIVVAAKARPAWLEGLLTEPGVALLGVGDALVAFAAASTVGGTSSP